MATLPPPVFEVTFRAYAFPDGVIPVGRNLWFTPDDLAHALITTGRAPGDWARYGAASAYEWLHRASLIPAYVRRSYRGDLRRSRLALELDRSELAAVSYALGQAMTAIFCRTQLQVTHLLHVDRYFLQFDLRAVSRKRPDMFGMSPTGWVVAEAKGRSRVMGSDLRRKLNQQKRSVVSIFDTSPTLALGCVASFPIRNGRLEIDAFDPEEAETDALAITGSYDDFLLAYYLPFLAIIDLGRPNSSPDYVVVRGFSDLGLHVGMLRSIYQRVRQAVESEQRSGLAEDVVALLADAPLADLGLLPDGTRVSTSWAEAIATQDWYESE